MRCEAEVRSQLQAGEMELRSLAEDIHRLSMEVKIGGEGWRAALETLSARIERRRALQAQLDSLRWVLTPSQASSPARHSPITAAAHPRDYRRFSRPVYSLRGSRTHLAPGQT